MVRSVTRLAVLVLVVLALAGCSGSDDAPDEDPGTFAVTLLRQLDRGQSASAWEELHPLHRDSVSRAAYVRCVRGDPIEGTVTSIDVLGVSEEPARVPGRAEDEDSTAVKLRYRLRVPGGGAPRPYDLTVHLFAVDGRWSWVIGPSDYAAYADGRCPS